MTQADVVKYWREGVREALETGKELMDNKRYNHALFFCHLAVEKQLKAVYVKKKGEVPPYTHHLIELAEKINITISKEIREQLREINTFNLEARYDDYKLKFYKKATPEYSRNWLRITEELLIWLENV
ncbi:MAG: HEPN domain-containing protein [Patescibacteria group bacterium]|mgnify:CR=1 FL=1